jgi:hypothetical protein
MKKITIIGDIHGRNTWKKIIEQNDDSYLFIFVGDYFDSFYIDITEQMHNFRDIITFKKENPDKVITLIGNHDFHYTSGCIGSYSGFNYSTYYNMKLELDTLIKEGVLQLAYQFDKYLFTHAGITKTWANEVGIDVDNLVDSLNEYLIYKPTVFNFRLGKNLSPYGDDVTQGPLWVRPISLLDDGLDYIHIVGHTQKVTVTSLLDDENDFGCILVDCLEYNQYLEILNDGDNFKLNVKKLNNK